MRHKNLEFLQKPERDPEIVAWAKTAAGVDYCFTLLWWRKSSEGWSIEFVGDRPLDQDAADIWRLMRYGQSVLQAQFELEQA